jgi:hypothetical protein
VSTIVAPTPSFYSFIYVLPLQLALVCSRTRLLTLVAFTILPFLLGIYNFADTSIPGGAYLMGSAFVFAAAWRAPKQPIFVQVTMTQFVALRKSPSRLGRIHRENPSHAY